MGQVKELLEYIFNMFKIWVIVQPWQQGIRVRFGKHKKLLNAGIHFKIPYFDSVFVQETRLRMINLPMQTVNSEDKETVTLNGALGYVITDIDKLYSTLYHPETTIMNITMANITDYVSSLAFNKISLDDLEEYVLNELQELDYGLRFEKFEVMNFVSVKTYRIIKEDSWTGEGLDMDIKKK